MCRLQGMRCKSPLLWSFLASAFMVLPGTSTSELIARAYEDIDMKTQNCALGFAQSAIVGTTIYVDGGYAWYNNGSDHRGPNMWLRILDTSKSFTVDNIDEISIEFQERPPEVPEVSAGNLWAYKDSLYLHQGRSETSDKSWPGWNPIPSGTVLDFWKYDIKTSSWDVFQHNPETISGAAVPRTQHSTSLMIESLAKAYLIGGEIVGGNGGFLKGIMIYDFEERTWEHRTTRAWETWTSGVAVHVPVEDPGYIFAFAGRSKEYVKLDRIEVYDLEKNNWGNAQQTTPADPRFPFPVDRQKPCSVLACAKDRSSCNVYVFGGIDLAGKVPYNDVWVLSIPSFKWFLVNSGSTRGPEARETMSCHIVGGGRKMLVYGGRYSQANNGAKCDQTGVHVFDMTTLEWDNVYDPDGGEYEVPKLIYDVIGGGPEGGATLLPVGGFANSEMETKFTKLISTIKESSQTGNTTNTNSMNEPSATMTDTTTPEPDSAADSSSKRSISTGAIVGIVIGVTIAVALLVALFWLRKYKSKKPKSSFFPAELSATIPTQELHHYNYSAHPQELHTPGPVQNTLHDGRSNSPTMSFYEPGKQQSSDPLISVHHQQPMSDHTTPPTPPDHDSAPVDQQPMSSYRL